MIVAYEIPFISQQRNLKKMKYTLSLILSLFVACQSNEVHSRRISYPRQNAVQINLVDENSYALPTYFSKGNTYVQGEYGQRYQIKVRNPYATRIEVIVTVDGRDVINGQQGSFSNRGYVLEPYQEAVIDGFRQSENQVATFRFSNPGNSYSSKMGTPENVGVIGLAVFDERYPEPVPSTPTLAQRSEEAALDDMDSTNSPSQGAKARRSLSSRSGGAEAEKSNLGTQYGESRYSYTQKTNFERRTTAPIQVTSLFYDNEAGLIKKGVITRPSNPSPFPQEQQYAPPPP